MFFTAMGNLPLDISLMIWESGLSFSASDIAVWMVISQSFQSRWAIIMNEISIIRLAFLSLSA